MPEPMTIDQSKRKICPFMSRPPEGWAGCQGDGCACWGWVDPEEVEVGEKMATMVYLPKGERPDPVDGGYWFQVSISASSDKIGWACHKIVGPRRGQCEAMSPNITVEAP